MVYWLQYIMEFDFSARPIYPVNQQIVLDELVVPKNQRAGKIKQNNMKVQIHTFTGEKDYKYSNNFRNSIV